MGFIAGQYLVTYGGSTVGQIKEGITIDHTVMKQKIQGDNMGLADQDGIYLGSNVYGSFTLLEYNATAARAAFWPYGASYLSGGIVGRLDSGLAAALVLTAIAGTPASSLPATLTLTYAILAEGFPVGLLFRPTLREIPIRMQAYPAGGGANVAIYGGLT